MSRLGLAFCTLYGAITGVCAALAITSSGDPKGRFVFLQLPIALQAASLDALGFGWILEHLSWEAAYLVLGIPTLAVLYLAGRFLGGYLR